jgi:uncharacterized membrane protein YfcA
VKLEEWDLIGPKAFVIFPNMALLAGFLSGMLGIGGGMIINPLLIEIGMHPQVNFVTFPCFVFHVFSDDSNKLSFRRAKLKSTEPVAFMS